MVPEVISSRADLFFTGALVSLQMTFFASALGLLVGLGLYLAKASKNWALRAPAEAVIWVLRGTPLLVQILFAYYALPSLLPFLKLEEFSAAVLALTLNVGAYNSEVFRSGFEAVPKSQREAAHSLGLSQWVTFSQIVLPQALRVAFPSLINNIVALLKDSSLASAIGLLELTLAGQRVSSETFQPVPVLTTVATFYLVMTTGITLVTTILEKTLLRQMGVMGSDRRLRLPILRPR